MTSTRDNDRAVAAAHGTAADEEAIRTAELAALIEFCLGEPLDRPTFDALARIQAKLREAQRGLAAEYELGVLGPEEYLPRINAVLTRSMGLSREVLGDRRFQAIFGEAGRNPDNLIDAETFLAQRRPTLAH